jgi:hypothetical protein
MDASRRTLRIVVAWNFALTAGAVGLVIAWLSPHQARFTEISVERIDVRDASGTRRMVISNRDRFPNIVLPGKEGQRSDRRVLPAGIVVYDEQGNEAGGYGTTAMPGSSSDGKTDGLAATGVELIDQQGKPHSPSGDASLAELERSLPPSAFFRVNRTEIVALAAIDHLAPDNDRIVISIKASDRRCTVSVHRAAAFRKWIGMT